MLEASRMGLYTAKCLPETTAVIARARRMRKNHPILRTIYLMTDGSTEWAEELSRWLLSDGWDKVFIAKLDVHSAWADQEMGPAVDVEVARRAGVFVGNGVSGRGQWPASGRGPMARPGRAAANAGCAGGLPRANATASLAV